MELRRELLLTMGALVVLNLLLALGAIGLFVRMGPAIDRILQENVYSIVAAEEILGALAAPREGADRATWALTDADRRQVLEALANAERNVTEKAERPVLHTLERVLPAAMNGEATARRQAVAAVGELIQINRQAMRVVDEEARRLGTAGAWAAVFVGFLSFLLSVLVFVRLQRRVVRPLLDLHDVLEDNRHGQKLRRCRRTEAPREVIQVSEAVNHLLDERLQRRADRGAADAGT